MLPIVHAAPNHLVVQPAALDLSGVAEHHRLLVTAVAADGTSSDVTTTAAYRSVRPEIVHVSGDGECRSVADGTGAIVVSFDGQTVTVPVTVHESAVARPPSFLNDVIPLLTRLGCNQGACHGKGAGQNGFRLSLRGYAPEKDYEWVTREFDGRRLNAAVPAESLFLRKPLGLASHEGGKIVHVGSREHRLFLDWLTAGVPGSLKDEATIRRLEILPGTRILRVGQTQRLLVRAEYSDGRVRDVTWMAKFDSNDAGVATVDPTGLVTIQRNGETNIRAAFQGLVAVVGVTVPFERSIDAKALAVRTNPIDELVFNKLAALRIEPSTLSDDAAFIRRVFLDTIGILPTPDEVRVFLAAQAPNKRAMLIDHLLQRPEFNDFWAVQLGDLFQNRKERDHDVRGTKGVRAFHEWIRTQIVNNRPWDQLARDVLTATGSSAEHPAVGYFVVTVGERESENSEVVASVAQAFLGTRIGCAQCHNHPLEKYTQDDYYHFAAFFSRLKFDRHDPKDKPTQLLVSHRDPNQNKNPVGVHQPRTGRFLVPQPLDRTPTSIKPGQDPRTPLVAWMIDPANEYFSGAMVNRLWKHYLSVGLVEPVDDLRASNPPSNAELWQYLNKEFVSHGFDLRHVMRLILNSRTYQLSSATTPANSTDARFYSHYYARRLPAEVLLDAMSQSTGIPDHFDGYPQGVRAVQVPDPALKSYFLSLFGRSERVTACACERSGEVTMPQLLHLLNGDTVLNKVRSGDGRLTGYFKANLPPTKIVDELFLTTFARQPTDTEAAVVRKELDALGRDEAGQQEFFRDLFWALLNSKEFCFNH